MLDAETFEEVLDKILSTRGAKMKRTDTPKPYFFELPLGYDGGQIIAANGVVCDSYRCDFSDDSSADNLFYLARAANFHERLVDELLSLASAMQEPEYSVEEKQDAIAAALALAEEAQK